MLFIRILILTLCITNTISYWLSQNKLPFDKASEYCQEFCRSDLASIHSVDAYFEAQSLIINEAFVNTATVTPTTASKKDRVWIGLNKINSTEDGWSWIDGSRFDFANHTTTEGYGTLPWNSDQPSMKSSEECVAYDTSWGPHHGWVDDPCEYQIRFLCNDCEGFIEKYVLYTIVEEYDPALQMCINDLETSLASIHNEMDLDLANFLCEKYIDDTLDDCWIGLHKNITWQWADDTYFDFGSDTSGGVHPWFDAQPNKIGNKACAEIKPEMGLSTTRSWNDNSCTNRNKFICSKPNAFCSNNTWNVMTSSNEIVIDGCEAQFDGNGSSMAMIGNKRWNLYNNSVVNVEFMCAIHDAEDDDDDAYVGIVIAQNEVDLCDHFFIGIGVEDGTNMYLKHGNNKTDLRQSLELDRYYRLRLELYIVSDTIFADAFVDDASIDNHLFFAVESIADYKYIGIRSSNAHSTIKSLYVSGTPQYQFNASFPQTYDCEFTAESYAPAWFSSTEDDNANVSKRLGQHEFIAIVASLSFCILVLCIVIAVKRRKEKKGRQAIGDVNQMELELEMESRSNTVKDARRNSKNKIEEENRTEIAPASSDDGKRDDIDNNTDLGEDDLDSELEDMYDNTHNSDHDTETQTKGELHGQSTEGNKDCEIIEWLQSIEMTEYADNFLRNGFDSLESVLLIGGEEQLHKIGIELYGHRLIILNAIKAFKSQKNTTREAVTLTTADGAIDNV